MNIIDKLKTIAENEQKVYEAGEVAGYKKGEAVGYNKGYDAGKVEGIQEGKDAEYNRFWDEYQQEGNTTRYNYAFTERWTTENFKPKYNIIPTQGAYMFRNFGFDGDLAEHLKSLNVILDTSNCTDLTQAFRAMKNVTKVPTINCSSITTSLNYFISECDILVTIEKIILPPSAITFTNAFNSDKKLEEIRFEGTIYNDIAFPSSPLSKESIENIVGCLDSGASGKTVTLLKSAVLNAFGTEAEWTTCIAKKSNWTFTLK